MTERTSCSICGTDEYEDLLHGSFGSMPVAFCEYCRQGIDSYCEYLRMHD